MHRCTGSDELFKPLPVLSTHLNHFHRHPVVVDLGHFCEWNIDTGPFSFQPQSDPHKITGNEMVRSRNLARGIGQFKHTTIGFKLPDDSCQHAVNRELGGIGRGLSHSSCHTMSGTIACDVNPWLFLKRWGFPHLLGEQRTAFQRDQSPSFTIGVGPLALNIPLRHDASALWIAWRDAGYFGECHRGADKKGW